MNMQNQAQALASKGRYGDSTLMHVNPMEVQGIAALTPGGLTTNPDTGLPEAFNLWETLAPVLGGAAMAALFPAMAPALASGLGSGIATAAVTGDLKRGLASGIMGIGMGKAFGAAGEAGKDVATSALGDVATDAAIATASPDAIASGTAGLLPSEGLLDAARMAPLQVPFAPEVAKQGIQFAGFGDRFADYMKAPFSEPGAFFEQLGSRGSAIPIAIGGGNYAELDRLDAQRELAAQLAGDSDERLKGTYERLWAGQRRAQPGEYLGYSPYRPDYLPKPYGFASGGITDLIRMPSGGQVPGMPYAPGNAPVDPVSVQANLRAQHSVMPPAGYLPGFNPEFNYFQSDPQNIQVPPMGNAQQWTAMYPPLISSGQRNQYFESFLPQQGAMPKQPPSQIGPINPINIGPVGMLPVSGLPDPVNSPPTNQPPSPQPPGTRPPPRRFYPEPPFDRRRGRRRARMAQGGDITLDTDFGPVQMPGGGITAIPNLLNERQAPGDGRPVPTAMQPEHAEMLRAAIMGQLEQEQADMVINAFIQKYGIEMFRAIREVILKQGSPFAQTEGKVEGLGGGMDDQVMGTIAGQQPIAVSPGEYIVPADVVSGLGDGSTDAGVQKLDMMGNDVRRMRQGGMAVQPPPVDNRVLPR